MKEAPTFLGWTWHAHFADLHQRILDERWLDVAKSLSLMLAYAVDQALKQQESKPR